VLGLSRERYAANQNDAGKIEVHAPWFWSTYSEDFVGSGALQKNT
jgi:hypothetical protein